MSSSCIKYSDSSFFVTDVRVRVSLLFFKAEHFTHHDILTKQTFKSHGILTKQSL